ncbi:hypothetical protein BMETH_1775775731427, partial [methanotrophic bacterial endosymbiont of Bathymodiolus sp.]
MKQPCKQKLQPFAGSHYFCESLFWASQPKQAAKFPQDKIIERAFQPRKPFSPDYSRNALIALAGSIILGLFSVWTVDYLTRREEQKASISISGLINSYQQKNAQLASNPPQSLQHNQNPALASGLPKELSDEELRRLLEAADIKTRQLVALLLSGLSLHEIASLQ